MSLYHRDLVYLVSKYFSHVLLCRVSQHQFGFPSCVSLSSNCDTIRAMCQADPTRHGLQLLSLLGVAAVSVSSENPAPLDVWSVGVAVTSVPTLGFWALPSSQPRAASQCFLFYLSSNFPLCSAIYWYERLQLVCVAWPLGGSVRCGSLQFDSVREPRMVLARAPLAVSRLIRLTLRTPLPAQRTMWCMDLGSRSDSEAAVSQQKHRARCLALSSPAAATLTPCVGQN